MTTIGELAAGITLDTSRFDKGIVATRAEISAASRTVKAAQTPLENYAQEIDKLDAQFRKGLISMETHTRAVRDAESAYKSSIPEAEKVADKSNILADKLAIINPYALAAAAGLAAMAAAAAVARAAISEAIEQAGEIDRIDKFASSVGFATEEIAGLEYAAGLSGSSIEGLKVGLTKFTKSVGASSKEFEKIGLDVEELQRLKPEEAFYKTVDAIQKLEQPSQRAAAAMGIFGKSAIDLLPLFAEGSEGIKGLVQELDDLGGSFSHLDSLPVQRMNDDISRMQTLWEGIGRTLAIEFAPQIAAILEVIIDVGKEALGSKDSLQDMAEGSAEAIAFLLDGLDTVIDRLDMIATHSGIKQVLALYDKIQETSGGGGFLGGLVQGLTGITPKEDGLGTAYRQKLADIKNSAGSPASPAMEEIEVAGEGIAEALDKEAEKIRESVETPGEKLQKTLDHLADVFDSGALDLEHYNRAVEKAEKDFADDSGMTKAAEEAQKLRDKLTDNIEKEEKKLADEKAKAVEKVKEDSKSPLEKLKEEADKLFDLFDAGDLTQKEYTKASSGLADKIRKEMEKGLTLIDPQAVNKQIAKGAGGGIERNSAQAQALEFAQKNPQIQKQVDIQIQQLNEARKTNQALQNMNNTVSVGGG